MSATSSQAKAGLSALYYPFSRCIDGAALKQLLLLFDSVAFLDPVDDDGWREHLFRQIEKEDAGYRAYRDVAVAWDMLSAEGAVRRSDPGGIPRALSDAASLSALSDLGDKSWAATAGMPEAYGLPVQRGPDESPEWHVFKPKLPDVFLDGLEASPKLRRHLVYRGRSDTNWVLSYQAGSAISTAMHLAAAELDGVSPVTDSALHHELLLVKLARQARSTVRDVARTSVSTQIAQRVLHSMIETLVPRHALEQLSFEDILEFRRATAPLRQEAVAHLAIHMPTALGDLPDEAIARLGELQTALKKELREYEAEMAAVRDRLWPAAIEALNTTAVPGSAAAFAVSYIVSPGYALFAGLGAAALAAAKTVLESRAQSRKAIAGASPGVAYLSRVKSFGGSRGQAS